MCSTGRRFKVADELVVIDQAAWPACLPAYTNARAICPICSLEKSMSRTPVRPFLIAKDENGAVRLTVRTTRLNSQNYPVVTSTLQDQSFTTAAAARAYAKAEFGAQPGQFASK
jgi:hypothetical protein